MQTIEFRAAPSQTVTLRLFAVGSDTQVASASATEATNRKGTYTATFTDIPAGEYQYIATIGTSPIIPLASGLVTLALATGTYQVYDRAKAVNLSEIVVDNNAIATAVVEKVITGSQPAGSLARFIRDIKQADVLFEGTIITATSDTATLNGDATTVCVGQAISIGEEGDIERQTRFVTAFDPDTHIVTLDRPWCVVPPDGSNYQIKTQRNPLVGRLSTYLADSFGAVLHSLSTMIEFVGGVFRFKGSAVEIIIEDIAEVKDDTEDILTGVNSLNNNNRGEFF